jgi:hypothetical protein
MKARDLFGVCVRVIGLMTLLYSLYGLCIAIDFMFIGGPWGASLFGCIPGAIVGFLLLDHAPRIVKFTYPNNKDDSET